MMIGIGLMPSVIKAPPEKGTTLIRHSAPHRNGEYFASVQVFRLWRARILVEFESVSAYHSLISSAVLALYGLVYDTKYKIVLYYHR